MAFRFQPAACLSTTSRHVTSDAGVHVIDFSTTETAMAIINGATVTLADCSFARNIINATFQNSAIIVVNAVVPDIPDKQDQDTILRMQQMSFIDNTAPSIIASATQVVPFLDFDVAVYSDEKMKVYAVSASPFIDTTLSLDEAPASRPGVDASSSWFLNMQEVRYRWCISTTCQYG